MAEPTAPLPPIPAADDGIRKIIACATIFDFTLIIILAGYALFVYGPKLPQGMLATITGLIGAVFGYKAGYQGQVIGYLYGSSSGSTAKNQ